MTLSTGVVGGVVERLLEHRQLRPVRRRAASRSVELSRMNRVPLWSNVRYGLRRTRRSSSPACPGRSRGRTRGCPGRSSTGSCLGVAVRRAARSGSGRSRRPRASRARASRSADAAEVGDVAVEHDEVRVGARGCACSAAIADLGQRPGDAAVNWMSESVRERPVAPSVVPSAREQRVGAQVSDRRASRPRPSSRPRCSSKMTEPFCCAAALVSITCERGDPDRELRAVAGNVHAKVVPAGLDRRAERAAGRRRRRSGRRRRRAAWACVGPQPQAQRSGWPGSAIAVGTTPCGAVMPGCGGPRRSGLQAAVRRHRSCCVAAAVPLTFQRAVSSAWSNV